jgi:hypothetical protein
MSGNGMKLAKYSAFATSLVVASNPQSAHSTTMYPQRVDVGRAFIPQPGTFEIQMSSLISVSRN